ncbi:hypothetical protein [Chromohalobacter japonicus]|uniref:hypothetical protein n=1 Tax=Chromohalobacter japonicus TaxID=223900 RepID=UPI000B2C2D62|nr:hypothetical protein [Chromohalobacter japonicus]
MSRSISDFALKLVFLDWRLGAASWTALGIGGAIVGHVGSENWSLNYTFLLMATMVALSIVSKCVLFAFSLYRNQVPRLQALRFIKGDGFNKGSNIIVFAPAEGFSKEQLVTLFCESSGAKQPISILEITAVNYDEIQAVTITQVPDRMLRPYFEEESRRKMLYATSDVFAKDVVSQGSGELR